MIINSVLPNQYVSEKEWTEEYYKKCAEAVLWNHISTTYSPANNINFYSEYWENVRLFWGEQLGTEWESIRQVAPNMVGGDASTAIYTPGKESHSIMMYHIGSMAKFISNMDKSLTTRSIANRNSRKSIMMDAFSFMAKNQDLAQTMEQVGIKLGGMPPTLQFTSMKEQAKFIEENYKETNEILAHYLATQALNKNRFNTEFKRQAAYAIICGITGLKITNTTASVIPQWNSVAPWNLIKDRRTDDDFGIYDEFVGEMNWYPIDIVIKMYNLSKEQAEKLRNTAASTYNFAALNQQYGYDMYYTRNRVGMVSVANCYWRSYKDAKVKGADRKDRYGNYHIKQVKGDDKPSYFLNTIRQCTLIGNDIVVNYGETENIPINGFGYRPPLPILTCQPMNMIGKSWSMANTLKGLQAQLDQYVYKLSEAINADYGKQLFYDPSKSDATTFFMKTLINLRTSKVHEINREDGDGKMELPVDMLDMSLSPTTSFYLQLIQATEEKMRVATSTSLIAQGMQTTTIGKGVQENTMQSNSVSNYVWIDSLLNHYNNVIQYTVDQSRMNIASKNETEIDIPLGLGDLSILKIEPDSAFEQVGIYCKFNDIPDEQMKSMLIQSLQPSLQAGLLSPDVITQVTQADTLTEANNIVDASYKAIQQQKQREMAAMAEQQAAMADQKDATARYVADRQVDMTNQAVEGRLTEKAMDIGSKMGEEGEMPPEGV